MYSAYRAELGICAGLEISIIIIWIHWIMVPVYVNFELTWSSNYPVCVTMYHLTLFAYNIKEVALKRWLLR